MCVQGGHSVSIELLFAHIKTSIAQNVEHQRVWSFRSAILTEMWN